MPAQEDDALQRQVRDALIHLHDSVYLQTHPLARLVAPDAPGRQQAGRTLHDRIMATIETLRPTPGSKRQDSDRGYQLLVLRYVEGLDPEPTWTQMGLGKSQYYREHDRALQAVTSLVADTWGIEGARRPPTPVSEAPTWPGRPPRVATTFIGREEELATLAHLLERDSSSRLVTLTGPPGCGKTRLAIAAATASNNGVCFVDLNALEPGSDAEVLSLVARALGVEPRGSAVQVLESLAVALSDRPVLLLLDNFEHVIDAARDVARLRERLPQARALVTSRRPLGIAGERELVVAPLPLPPPGQTDTRSIEAYPTVQLFVQRAHPGTDEFRLTDVNAEAVAEICRRLDGLPLAIELAAARVKVLPPEALLRRLEDRLGLLTRGTRDAPARHQTLAAAIDWSYQLLEAGERAGFRGLGIFTGAFTLDAAAAVTAMPPQLVLDVIQSLLDCGLLQAEPGDAEPRYRMLQTIREFALDQLAASGEAPSVRERYADYYVRAGGSRAGARVSRLAAEDEDSLRGALEAVLTESLESSGASGDRRLAAMTRDGLGGLAEARGDFEAAAAHYESAAELFESVSDQHGAALARAHLREVAGRLAEHAHRREHLE